MSVPLTNDIGEYQPGDTLSAITRAAQNIIEQEPQMSSALFVLMVMDDDGLLRLASNLAPSATRSRAAQAAMFLDDARQALVEEITESVGEN